MKTTALFSVAALALLIALPAARTQSTSTWTGAVDDIYGNSANWTAGSPDDYRVIANFGPSSQTTIDLGSNFIELDSLHLITGAPSYTLTSQTSGTLILYGQGLINDSSVAQTLIIQIGTLTLNNTATIRDMTVEGGPHTDINFAESSTAGNSILNNIPSLEFSGSSSAANANISLSSGDAVSFSGASTGGSARVTLLSSSSELVLENSTGSISFGSISGMGSIDFDNNEALTVGGNNDSTTFSGKIRENTAQGSLIKTGTGTFTLSGTNTYTGGTTIAGGTLSLGSAAALGPSGNITFTGGTLQFTAANTTDYSSRIANSTAAIALDTNGQNVTFASALAASNTGGLTKIGAGTLTLNGANAYTGATTVNAGTLTLGASGAIDPASPLAVAAGATFDSSALSNLTVGELSGAGNIAAGSGSLTTTQSTSTTFSGVMSGFGRLAMSGTGVLTVTGNNTFTAATFANAGTIVFSTLNNLGQGPNFQFNGGTLQWAPGNTTDLSTKNVLLNAGGGTVDTNGNNVTFANAIGNGFTGALTKAGAGTLTLAGANTYTGITTINGGTLQLGTGGTTGSVLGNITDNATLALNRSDSFTLANVISGSGSVTQSGTGTVALTGANTYTGGTTINSGIIQLGSASALGTGPVTFGYSTGLSWAPGTTLDPSALFNPLNGSSHIYFDTNGNNVTFATALTGTGGLTKLGAGTLTLTGANSLGLGANVNFGTLTLSGSGTSFSATAITVGSFTAGSLQVLNGATATVSSMLNIPSGTPSPITIDGSGSKLTVTGTLSQYTGALNVTNGGWLNVGGLALFGQASGTGSFPIMVTGPGSLLSIGGNLALATNSPGVLTIQNGGTVSVGGTLNLDQGISAGTLNLNPGGTLLVGGTDGIQATLPSNLNLAGGTLRVTGSALTTNVGAAVLGFSTIDTNGLGATWSGVLTGFGGLTKAGAGTLTLNAANTYTGGTTVDTGTLLVNGSLAAGAVAVNAGATLGGSGSIGGLATFASGAHLAPGNSPGTLTFTSGLTLNNGSVLDLQLGALSNLINVSGGTLTGPGTIGGVTLNLSNAGGFTAGTYTLLNYTTASQLSANSFALGSTIAGYSSYNLALVGNSLELTVAAIPEPATYAALAGLGALGLAAWRKRART